MTVTRLDAHFAQFRNAFQSAVTADAQGGGMDVQMLFIVLFGAGKFEDTFGDVGDLLDPQMFSEETMPEEVRAFHDAVRLSIALTLLSGT